MPTDDELARYVKLWLSKLETTARVRALSEEAMRLRDELARAQSSLAESSARAARLPVRLNERRTRAHRARPDPGLALDVEFYKRALGEVTRRRDELSAEAQPVGELVHRLQAHLERAGVHFDGDGRPIRPARAAREAYPELEGPPDAA